MAETQKERIMKILRCSAEEADEILACDKAIDRGERMPFDLSPEEEKRAKKYANSTEKKKPTVFKFEQRQRKENPTKAAIIQYLFECLKDYDNVLITNKERQISFSCGDNNFELTLVQKRKSKA